MSNDANHHGDPISEVSPPWRRIDLPHLIDDRGALTVAEALPFSIRRAFWLTDVPTGAVRGSHAHRTLHELIVAVRGSIRVLVDDGTTRDEIYIDTPRQGIYIPPMVWNEVDRFSPGAACLVLVSDVYDEADYIRNRAEFLAVTRGEP